METKFITIGNDIINVQNITHVNKKLKGYNNANCITIHLNNNECVTVFDNDIYDKLISILKPLTL